MQSFRLSAAIMLALASAASAGSYPTGGTVEIVGPAGAPVDSAAGTQNGQALTVQGNPSGVPVPVTFGAGGSVTQAGGPWTQNLTQIGGVAVSTGAGATDSGTIRAVLATDSGTQRVVLATGGATQSTVAPGTAPANASVVGGVYTATAPSPSDGQTMAVRLDSAGNLKIAASIGAPNKLSQTYSSIASNAVTTIAARATRHAITITNAGTANLCDVSSSSATSCAGSLTRIRPGAAKTFDYPGPVYLISESGTGTAEIDETYF